MKFVAVTGATGFIGRALCAELSSRCIAVRRLVRSCSASEVDTVAVGLTGPPFTNWTIALAGVDSLVHLAARVHVMRDLTVDPLAAFREVNVAGTLSLARQAAETGVRRFVFISSIGVNGNATLLGQKFTADCQPAPHDPYSISKYDAEQGLRAIAAETGLEVVIIRPPLVYGFAAPGNFRRLVSALQKGIPLPLGAIYNARSLVALDNLVDLIVTCLNHPAAANQTFLVSDGEDLSTTDLLKRTAAAMGIRPRLIPVPSSFIQAGATLLGKRDVAQRLCGSLQVDISKTRDILGWTPPVTVDEALRRTAGDFFRKQRSE